MHLLITIYVSIGKYVNEKLYHNPMLCQPCSRQPKAALAFFALFRWSTYGRFFFFLTSSIDVWWCLRPIADERSSVRKREWKCKAPGHGNERIIYFAIFSTSKQFCFRQPGQATQLFAKPNDPRPRLGCIQSCVTPYVWAKVHSLLGGEYGQIREPGRDAAAAFHSL